MNYERVCPRCKRVVAYSTKGSRDRAEKSNSICKECCKEVNPFAGKKHTLESREKISQAARLRYKNWMEDPLKRQQIEAILKLGRKRNRSTLEAWIDKYGEEKARELYSTHCKKLSLKGSKNGMYGKPAPQGSGNGWSGWYKDWYFRSIRELSFVINYLEKNNLEWETGELKKYRVEWYDYRGVKRNYYPDFVVGNIVYECKPKRLWNTPTIKAKTEAAKKVFKDFRLVDPPLLTKDEIKSLVTKKVIRFLDRYQKKYEDKYS